MRHSCNASRSRGVIAAALSALTATAVLGVLAAPAHAHEEREAGDFILEVGWAEEPTFTGFRNRVQVVVTDTDEEPVTDLGDNGLQVEVTFGESDEQIEMPLEPQFTDDSGRPGEYGAAIVPTRPGIYTFRVFGSIGDTEIDESFTASPDTFEEVREPTDIQFPASELTVTQLNERLDRELGRLGAASEAPADTGDSGGDGGGDGAGTVLGIVGIVFGAVGIAGAGLALRRSRALA